jgi:poly-gamma-glutamate synthesis protein (capsule biosynthesis protein)
MVVILIMLITIISTDNFNSAALTRTSDPNNSEITLVLTGDIMVGRRVETRIVENNDIYFPFRGIGDYTKKGDITFGNLETTISERGEALDKTYTFRASPNTLFGVRDAGFDVLSLANNHIRDFSWEATQDTMDFVDGYGMKHVGLWYLNEPAENASIPRPVMIEAKGVRFAFLGYTENPSTSFLATETIAGPVPIEDSIMRADVEYAKSVADVVVVALHWARLPQYVKVADPGQIEICHNLCNWGVDILANHGPHVLQEVEYYNDSLIFYSLGNTVFDLSNTSSHYSMLATLTMRGTEFDRLELVPIVKNEHDQYIPRGNILELEVTEDLYLDWTDYQTKMFNSDKLIDDSPGSDSKNNVQANPDWLVAAAVVGTIGLTLAILLILIYKRFIREK